MSFCIEQKSSYTALGGSGGLGSKYQVPAKLFKKLGTESEVSSSSSPTLSVRMLSPRSLLSKTKIIRSQTLIIIPKVLRDCVDFLREDDREQTEGLFRVPGDSDLVNRILTLYDTNTDVDLDIFASENATAHDVASVMKRYLMKMASPLLDDSVKKDLLSLVKVGMEQEKDQQFIAYQVVVRCLEIPDEQRSALAYIARFLLLISNPTFNRGGSFNENSSDTQANNKMTVESLAKMFAPIFFKDDAGIEGSFSSMTSNGSATNLLLSEQVRAIDHAIVATEILIWNAVEIVPKAS